jgi:hypothetical protein
MPTSAITASHKLATPPAPKAKTITFTVMAMMMFCQVNFFSRPLTSLSTGKLLQHVICKRITL